MKSISKHIVPIPTDRSILKFIYRMYYDEYASFTKDSPSRIKKNWIPIDIEKIANHFNVDVDIIFGRLYHYMNNRYSYFDKQKLNISFFELNAIDNGRVEKHLVNFVLLSSVLSGMNEEASKNFWTIGLSITSIVISIIALLIAS